MMGRGASVEVNESAISFLFQRFSAPQLLLLVWGRLKPSDSERIEVVGFGAEFQRGCGF